MINGTIGILPQRFITTFTSYHNGSNSVLVPSFVHAQRNWNFQTQLMRCSLWNRFSARTELFLPSLLWTAVITEEATFDSKPYREYLDETITLLSLFLKSSMPEKQNWRIWRSYPSWGKHNWLTYFWTLP